MMQDDVTSMLQPVAFSSLLYDHVVLIFYTQRVSKDDEENSMIHVWRVTQSICTDGLSIHEEALKKKIMPIPVVLPPALPQLNHLLSFFLL